MPRFLVTQTWVVNTPEASEIGDPFDWARDYVLNTRPDAEDIEVISDDNP